MQSNEVKVVRAKPRKVERGMGNPEPRDLGKVREISAHLANNREFMEKEGFVLYEEPEVQEPKTDSQKQKSKSNGAKGNS